jgi:hypothetical protein
MRMPIPPRLMAVPRATRQGARGARPVVGDLVEAWQRGDVVGRSTALAAAIPALACHAQRAHPARDRQRGRSQLGLALCCANADAIECAEAA